MPKFKTKFKILTISFFIFFGFFALVGSAQAANWYVDNACSTNGNNSSHSWTCGASGPWNSFANINWSSLSAGDTIYISGGSTSKTYNEKLQVNWGGSSEADRIYIRPGQDANHNGVVIITATGDWATGVGIRLGGASPSCTHYVTINGGYNGSRHIRVTASSAQGVQAYCATSYGNKYLYLEVDHNGTNQTTDLHGLDVGSAGSEIGYCYIHDNFADGVNGGGADTGYGGIIIHHNTIDSNGDDGVQAWGGVDIYNNIIKGRVPPSTNPSFHPDGAQLTPSYLRFYNNIVSDFSQGLYIATESNPESRCTPRLVIFNNVFYEQYFTTDTMVALMMTTRADSCGSRTWDKFIILNNTIYGTRQGGIRIQQEFGTNPVWTFTNSIIANNINAQVGSVDLVSGNGSFGTISDANFIFDYNVWTTGQNGDWFPGETNYATFTGSSFLTAHPTFTHHYYGQPSFINPSVRDFRLSSSDTVARDKGHDYSAFLTAEGIPITVANADIDGLPMPEGSAWDIGAYQYAGGADTTPPSAPMGLSVQ